MRPSFRVRALAVGLACSFPPPRPQRERIRLVVSPQASSEVRAVRAAARSLGVVLLSQGSTAHSLAIRNDNVFRFVPDDIREGEALVALLRKEGIAGAVPVWRNDTGNSGLVDSVGDQFEAAGENVAPGVRYGTRVTDFAATVAAVAPRRQPPGRRASVNCGTSRRPRQASGP